MIVTNINSKTRKKSKPTLFMEAMANIQTEDIWLTFIVTEKKIM